MGSKSIGVKRKQEKGKPEMEIQRRIWKEKKKYVGKVMTRNKKKGFVSSNNTFPTRSWRIA